MHDLVNGSSATAQRPAADAIVNVALILNVSAFVAFAICLGQIGYGSAAVATTLGIFAVVCFVASLVCFATDAATTATATSNGST